MAGGATATFEELQILSTTELLLPGASSWIPGTPLPKAPRSGVRAAGPHGEFGLHLTGIDRSVLWYNPATGEWVEVGTTKTEFRLHTAVAGDLALLCQ